MTDSDRAHLGLTETESADRPTPQREGPAVERARAFAIEVARLLHDSRCEDVLLYDMRGLSEVTDFMIVASGTSDRQIKSAARYVGELAAEHGFERFGSDRDDAATWVVLDYVDLLVHLFEPTTRAHYDLEMMWGDAEQIAWQRA